MRKLTLLILLAFAGSLLLADSTLSAWRSKISSGGIVQLVVLGDSIARGQGVTAGTAGSWPNLLGSRSAPSLQSRGKGLQTFATSVQSVTTSGVWSDVVGWGLSYLRSAGSSATFQITCSGGCDTVDIVYATGTDSGNGFGFQVDGGASTTYGAATSANYVWAIQTIALGSLASHALKLTAPSSGNVYLFGVSARIAGGLSGGGLIVHNVGINGAATATLAQSWCIPTSGSQGIYQSLGWLMQFSPTPDVVTIALQTNDEGHLSSSDYQTDLGVCLSYLQANLPNTELFLIAPSMNNSHGTDADQAVYDAATQALSVTYAAEFINIHARWGTWATANANGLMFDSLHPNDAGHADIATAIMGLIFGPAGNGLIRGLASGRGGVVR